jgi:hypothetical protein
MFVSIISIGQEITGPRLLDKAIAYHDPLDHWNSFKGKLFVVMEIPNKSNRETEIIIDLPEEYFYSKAIRDSIIIEFTVDKEQCEIKFNGEKEFLEEIAKEYRLNC